MNRHFRRVFVGALIVALVGAGAVYAQGPGRGRGPGAGRGPDGAAVFAPMLPLRQLDLSEAQQAQIRQLTERHRSEVRPVMERLRTAADARREAMAVVPVDEGRIRATMEELARVQADLAVHQARLHGDILALLTPEQQARARQLQAEREARIEQRRQRMQERLQQQRQPA